MDKVATEAMMAAFFDELESIEKEAGIRALRTGLGKFLTRMGKKLAPEMTAATKVTGPPTFAGQAAKGVTRSVKMPPPTVPGGATWTMGPQQLATSPVGLRKAIAAGATPPKAFRGSVGPVPRATESGVSPIAAIRERFLREQAAKGVLPA